ncbi:hypothetical protein GCM10010178_89460 [Lentzea flava]|uniref:Transposase n=1 Tax=Lentzea flava TaxID=103732 RepID=A0ABQ2VG70_9PSEU|nr:hypothetical protein GCM10010178_89460 [Lentzea flava]
MRPGRAGNDNQRQLKSTILGGRVLRARTPTGVQQELYALLVTYQALRLAISDATSPVPTPIPTAAASPSPIPQQPPRGQTRHLRLPDLGHVSLIRGLLGL